ncbi:Phosphatidate cytidylyltransferase [Anaerobiospirillum thomasii]|uniref:phosphatidate cytidylyltransferase n=1 Tax=Anaerobiospirillum thomasii TaxID=179995 RepID=UPI000D98DE56|nr:phosphatidate cytidylyltransferase [Anaerobiospirillum thomasii]SPT71725.1 Phosphatidate cytidylyltransferase [Anaerobiospirillum thomasii]
MGIRIITALCLLALAYVWLFVVDYEFFVIGALAIYTLGAYEMGPLLGFKSRLTFLLTATVASSAVFYFAPPGLYIEGIIPSFVYYLIAISCLFWIGSIPLLKSFPKNTAWHNNTTLTTFLALFMLLPFLMGIIVLRSVNYHNDRLEGSFLVLAVMALVWLADSGAYFTGRAFGRHKLLEAVSPKKTLEGVYGGIAAALIGLSVFSYYDFYSIYQVNTIALYVAGCAAIIFSVIGDLVESMFKRIVDIKDSGRIFPGHGGMLDRIDSQLAAVPVFISFYLLLDRALF